MMKKTPGLNQRLIRARLISSGAILLTLSCGGSAQHVRERKPKVRKYKAEKYAPVQDRSAQGSLWDERADTLFTFRRAARVGDLITVLISESANATRDAGTNLARSGSQDVSFDAFLGLMKALKGTVPNPLVDVSSASKFSGTGRTQRSGSLRATLTARIKTVLPNGDFYIEGAKVVLVNNEESHFYFSGVVRPADVQADNTVHSASVADAEVEYTGRGDVAEQQKRGWFAKIMEWVSPF